MSKAAEYNNKKYPSDYEKRIKLRTGEVIFLRPVKESDGVLIRNFFSKLSRQSIYFRFLADTKELSDNMLRQFTHIDYVKNFGLVAVIDDGLFKNLIAVARYEWNAKIQMPECAIVIRDDWQGKGLGTILFQAMIKSAGKNGFIRLRSVVSPDNTVMKRIIGKSGFPYICMNEFGMNYYESDISAAIPDI